MGFVSPSRSPYLYSNPAMSRRRAHIERAEACSPITLAVVHCGEPQHPQAEGIPPEIAPCSTVAEAVMKKDGTGSRSQPGHAAF
jgi:hypothetical protein